MECSSASQASMSSLVLQLQDVSCRLRDLHELLMGQFHFCSTFVAAANGYAMCAAVPSLLEPGNLQNTTNEPATAAISQSRLRRLRAKQVRNRLWLAASSGSTVINGEMDEPQAEAEFPSEVSERPPVAVEDCTAHVSEDGRSDGVVLAQPSDETTKRKNETLVRDEQQDELNEDGEQTDVSGNLLQHHAWHDIPADCIWEMVGAKVEKRLASRSELGVDAEVTEEKLRAAFAEVMVAVQPLVSEEQWEYITEAWLAASQALDGGLLNTSASSTEVHGERVAPSFKVAGISKRGMAQQRARSKKKR